jgi:hypothetical protein
MELFTKQLALSFSKNVNPSKEVVSNRASYTDRRIQVTCKV